MSHYPKHASKAKSQEIANDHTKWVNKEQERRLEIEALMPFFKNEQLHAIHRQLGILFEHLAEYGDMKKQLAAMKNYRNRGNVFHGSTFNGKVFTGQVPTDRDVNLLEKVSKRKQLQINIICGSLRGHYQETVEAPVPFTNTFDSNLKVLQTYLRHLGAKFNKARFVSIKQRSKRSTQRINKNSFNVSAMFSDYKPCAA